MPYLAMIRHGLSDWNQENRFTGWVDVDLSETGVEQAERSGELLRAEGDRVRPRLHLRPQAGDPHALDRARPDGPDVAASDHELAPERAPLWRPAGTEQGGDRRQARRRAGEDLAAQLRHAAARPWRSTTRCTRATTRATQDVPPQLLPAAESLKITLDRVMPYWGEVDRAAACRAARTCWSRRTATACAPSPSTCSGSATRTSSAWRSRPATRSWSSWTRRWRRSPRAISMRNGRASCRRSG